MAKTSYTAMQDMKRNLDRSQQDEALFEDVRKAVSFWLTTQKLVDVHLDLYKVAKMKEDLAGLNAPGIFGNIFGTLDLHRQLDGVMFDTRMLLDLYFWS